MNFGSESSHNAKLIMQICFGSHLKRVNTHNEQKKRDNIIIEAIPEAWGRVTQGGGVLMPYMAVVV